MNLPWREELFQFNPFIIALLKIVSVYKLTATVSSLALMMMKMFAIGTVAISFFEVLTCLRFVFVYVLFCRRFDLLLFCYVDILTCRRFDPKHDLGVDQLPELVGLRLAVLGVAQPTAQGTRNDHCVCSDFKPSP